VNGTRSYGRWLRRMFAYAALAAAGWSCLAMIDNRQQAWAQEMQQNAFYPAAHSITVENFFSALR